MKFGFTTLAAAAALAIAAPAAAQDDADPMADGTEEMDAESLAMFGEMMSGIFQAEPLTAEQEARLPLSREIVGTMMPDGFYADMMEKIMGETFGGIMSMFGGESAGGMVLASRLDVEADTLDELGEAERAELAAMLDPAYDRRMDAISGAMSEAMGTAFAQLEPPMRDGLSRAYAVRFDESQLRDIATFFATPTGQLYATESMALFADPQVMSATMSAMPAMMGSFGDMEASMKAAMDALPKERGWDDLSAAERRRMAQLLNLSVGELQDKVRAPKPMDGSLDEGEHVILDPVDEPEAQ